jgi:transposase
MAYREVTMVEIKEVLRQWLSGVPKKRIARRLGADPKTVRRYVRAGERAGLELEQGPAALTDDGLAQVLAMLRGDREREHGQGWWRCEEQKDFIEQALKDEVRLKKVWRLLRRRGVEVAYPTLHRFAVEELGFGRASATVPVVDGVPGEELQVDTGWVAHLAPDASGRRRRVRAWIFTPNVSRYRFVYPCFQETTESAIEACEAAWEFYGGVFRVLVPDNTKAIIIKADPLKAKVTLGFLEYAQARGFHVDPTRVRSPQDKGRVERSVRDTREDCFGGEHLVALEDARAPLVRGGLRAAPALDDAPPAAGALRERGEAEAAGRAG